MKRLYWTIFLVALCAVLVRAEPSVHILAENLEQIITSTTLEWVATNGEDKEVLKNAVVAAYQTVEEPKDNEASSSASDSSIEGSTGLARLPVFVCRAKLNGVLVAGQLRPNRRNRCVVSMYRTVSEADAFDVLVNIEGSARLSWVHKSKYTLISQGAVTSGENIQRTFVARRPANGHDLEGSLSHYVGKFNSNVNLGMFYVVDQNNIEIQCEEGEILVETEPVRYELKSIRYERTRKRQPKKARILGHATLKNEEDSLQRVDSVISFDYDYSLFWGKGHGLSTGLPLKVSLPNGTQIDGSWAIPIIKQQVEVAPIERYLESGTAVNVTLMGNYTDSEIPYTAVVVCIYADNERREITIHDTKRENKMVDVVAVYDPVYFIHNNTHVPTTTTTTTTTTSTTTTTTTTKSTSTTQQVLPIVPPEVVNKENAGQLSIARGNVPADEQTSKRDNSSLKKEPETGESTSGSSRNWVLELSATVIAAVVLCRVT